MGDVQDTPRRSDHSYRPVASRISGNGAVRQIQHGVERGRGRHAVCAIAWTPRLRAGPRIVEEDLVVAHRYKAMDAVPGARIDTVILDPVLKLVFAVGKFPDLSPHPLLGVVHQRFAGSEESFQSVALKGPVQSPLGYGERTNHRVEVTP